MDSCISAGFQPASQPASQPAAAAAPPPFNNPAHPMHAPLLAAPLIPNPLVLASRQVGLRAARAARAVRPGRSRRRPRRRPQCGLHPPGRRVRRVLARMPVGRRRRWQWRQQQQQQQRRRRRRRRRRRPRQRRRRRRRQRAGALRACRGERRWAPAVPARTDDAAAVRGRCSVWAACHAAPANAARCSRVATASGTLARGSAHNTQLNPAHPCMQVCMLLIAQAR
jgi:hypothetical protein